MSGLPFKSAVESALSGQVLGDSVRDKTSESPVSHDRPGGGAGGGGGGGLEGRRERVPVALQEVISAPPTAALSWPLEEHPAEGKGADRDHRFPGRQRPAPARTMAPWRWQFPTEEPRRSDANHTRLRQLAGGADA